MPSPARLFVDLDALAANFHTLTRVAGAPVHPVVKADGYGLGGAAVARRLLAEGADTFFVARVAGGEALRKAVGSRPTIYVLDGCGLKDVLRLQAAQLRPVLSSLEQIRWWLGSDGGPCALHIDTGMNRLGVRPEEAPEPFPGLEMVISHLACADDPEHSKNRAQRAAFELAARKYPGTVRYFASSGGVFLGQDFIFDAVRPGVCLYGGGPEGRPDARIRPVARFTADILQVRDLLAGETVGYGRTFEADRPMMVATVAAGYADGVLRSWSPRGRVFVGGELRPVLGRISMDLMCVDVTGLEVRAGDTVELFGPNHPVDLAAADAGTIAYELLTSVSPRVPRVYV